MKKLRKRDWLGAKNNLYLQSMAAKELVPLMKEIAQISEACSKLVMLLSDPEQKVAKDTDAYLEMALQKPLERLRVVLETAESKRNIISQSQYRLFQEDQEK